MRYEGADELIDKVRWYLAHDEERLRIARNGYRRAMKDYRIHHVLQRGGDLIEAGMARIRPRHASRDTTAR